MKIGYACAAALWAASLGAQELPVVKASGHAQPPAWAVMERQLIRAMEQAAPVYLKRFTRPGGTLYGEGPVDDVYEMFVNWPLFYAMGADETLFLQALQEWNVISRHYEETLAPGAGYPRNRRYTPQLHKEFYSRHADCDWFHLSEGLMSFYDFAVGDPAIPENIRRAKRFAGFYMGEDPDAPNWDAEHKLIRAPFSSSQGPLFQSPGNGVGFVRYRLEHGNHASLYPVIKELEPRWWQDPERRKQVLAAFDATVMRGDVPLNLSAVGLVTNAYLYTGEEKYKRWVLDYVEAWMERIRRNHGIVPDNVGLSDKIGEYREGQWWGGHFGWTGLYSLHMIHGALTVAAECAQLVSGDAKYLDLLRSQIDVILKQAVVKDGRMLVPFNYGSKGWENFRPMMVRDLAHLWHESMDPADWERIERVRAGSKEDWLTPPVCGDRADFTFGRYPSLMYYGGRNPDWPEKALKADLEEVSRRLEFMRKDKRPIREIFGDDLYVNNPVVTKALAQVTMGAPQTIYNGGLLRARVRYFDPERQRPGLPPDVAALVSKLEAGSATIELVNLDLNQPRAVVVQAGAFGEHQFTSVVQQVAGKPVETPVNGKYFRVDLAPGSALRIEAGMKRFVNTPSYAFPWHGGKVPLD